MSSSHVPSTESSSQFLISQTNESSQSSVVEDVDDASRVSSTAGSKDFMPASGENVENVKKFVVPTTPEDYERKTIIKIMDIKGMAEQLQQQISDSGREELVEQSKKIEEILIQNTLALDNTETKNLSSIKELRRNTILYIQGCLKLLDAKLK